MVPPTKMRAAKVIAHWQHLPRRIARGLLVCSLISCQPAQPPAPNSTAGDAQPADTDTSIAINAEAPPPPPANSYLAHLPPDVTNQLVSLGINIVIPTYLTQNMTLANYGVGDITDGNTPYYWLVYRDDQNRCFAIEYTASSIRSNSLENQEPIDSALFGDGYSLHHGKFPNGGKGELPASDLFTDWLAGNDGFYRLIGAGLVDAQNYSQSDCSNITVEEAINVAESLSYLPTDIRTLDAIPAEPNF